MKGTIQKRTIFCLTNSMRTGFILWRRPNSPRSSHHAWERLEKWAISSGLTLDWPEGPACGDAVCRCATERDPVCARWRARGGAMCRAARSRDIGSGALSSQPNGGQVLWAPEQSGVHRWTRNVDAGEKLEKITATGCGPKVRVASGRRKEQLGGARRGRLLV